MRTAIYVRVSTEEQATEGYSMDAQKAMLTDYSTAEDWNIVKIYEDEGYSGRNIKRPAYSKMMEEIDQWDVLLVVKMDRIHRNSRNFMNMMDTLNMKNKMFVSSTESLDTTNALGRFVVDMIQRIAQLESEQIGERTYMGMREKAESMNNTFDESRTLGFNPPYGYDLSSGVLISISEELNIISLMFKLYDEGSTMSNIAYFLNSSKVLTRRGNPWNVYNVRTILHNPIYAGFLKWDDVLIKHHAPIVITPEIFNSVHNKIASKIKGSSKSKFIQIPYDKF